MKIAYQVQPDQYGSHLYMVALQVHLALPMPNAPRTKRFEAIIDSGASRCMFHADIGRHIGLDIPSGHLETTQGIGGSTECWIHPVQLYVPGGPVTIHAGFKENLPVAGLLGMNGFFEFFIVTFVHTSQICEIDRIQSGQT